MSWSGFKKGVQRATNQVLVKTEDKVYDRVFETEERRYKVLRKASEAMQKEAKGYLDNLRAVNASQIAMGEIIARFYEDAKTSGSERSVADVYHDIVVNFDTNVGSRIDEPLRVTVLDPINKFCNYFVDVDEAIKKRDHKKTDFEQAKAKNRRVTNNFSNDTTKLPRLKKELDVAQDIYSVLNEQLKKELPELIALRVPYFDASFEALIKIQMIYCDQGFRNLSELQQYLAPDERENYANGSLDQRIDDLLDQMRGLEICMLGS